MPNEAVKRILLIEDDPEVRRLAQAVLGGLGYRVIETDRVEAGLHAFSLHKPDLVVLDIQLPDGNGLEVCDKIRSHKTLSDTPVIMLTGKGQMADKVSGFRAGADQYLVKPVHPKELAAWVQALLRRIGFERGEGEPLRAGELEIDVNSHTVRFQGRTLPRLTIKEFELLYFLVKNRPKVLSRSYILKNLWHTIAVEHVVDTHLANLRRKVPLAVADRIQTIPGKGFFYLE